MTSLSNGTPAPTRGVPITLDKKRYLRYSLKTIRALREEFGASVLEEGLAEDKIAKVLWYGLKDSDPDLTEAAIDDLIDLENLPAVLEALGKAMGYKKGRIVSEDEANPPEAPAGAVEPAVDVGEGPEALG